MGVKPYEGSVQFIRYLRRHGFKIGVVTSSQNCTAVLKAVNLDACFDAQVDKGNAEELKQHGAHLVVSDLGERVD